MNLTKLKTMAEFDEKAMGDEAVARVDKLPNDWTEAERFGHSCGFGGGARYQHTKDKALNELLMRIVTVQSEALKYLCGERCAHQNPCTAKDANNDVAKLIEEFKPSQATDDWADKFLQENSELMDDLRGKP